MTRLFCLELGNTGSLGFLAGERHAVGAACARLPTVPDGRSRPPAPANCPLKRLGFGHLWAGERVTEMGWLLRLVPGLGPLLPRAHVAAFIIYL